jgi:HlyD family secretion protein
VSAESVSPARARQAWQAVATWARLGQRARALDGAVRPWLRREAWTGDHLRRTGQGLLDAGRRNPRRAAKVVIAIVAGLVLLSWLLRTSTGGVDTAFVREGPFKVTIIEAGTLQALQSRTYASTIQSNQAKIIALAPEGKMVQKDDLLILFDAAPFEEEIRRSQALLQQAQADLEKAKQDLKLQDIQNSEEVASARQKVASAKLELEDVRDGKGLVKEEEAMAAVAGAERELQKAQTAYDDQKPLLAEGFITKQELERAAQAVQHATEQLALARKRRDSVTKYGRRLELARGEADLTLAQESFRQLQSATAFRLEQKRAAISAAESRIQEAGSKLNQAQQQLARCEVRADVPGIVVYRDVFFGSEQRKPQVGDQVWANQPLLILPDISKMVVESKVRETDVHKVEKNQKVAVRVEAYPDLKLTGKVTLIGTLAQEERERPRSKFFGVTVEVNERNDRLRPGMTARIEIEVGEPRKALYVPLEAVFEKEGRSICYVVTRRGVEPREVVLGPSNRDFVVVEEGLRRGERVALRDPEAPTAESASSSS